MRMSELRTLLTKLMRQHGDLDILTTRYSDYERVDADWFRIVDARRVPEGLRDPQYVMRHHATDPVPPEKFFHIDGN